MKNTILFFAVLVLAIPALAQNVKNIRSAYSYSLDFTYASCTYGDLEATISVTGIARTQIDSTTGNILRVSDHQTTTVTFFNPLSGKMASGTGAENDTFPYVDGQQTGQISRGQSTVISLPGVGTLRLVGRIVYDFTNGFAVTFQTPKVVPDAEFTSTLCAALQ